MVSPASDPNTRYGVALLLAFRNADRSKSRHFRCYPELVAYLGNRVHILVSLWGFFAHRSNIFGSNHNVALRKEVLNGSCGVASSRGCSAHGSARPRGAFRGTYVPPP